VAEYGSSSIGMVQAAFKPHYAAWRRRYVAALLRRLQLLLTSSSPVPMVASRQVAAGEAVPGSACVVQTTRMPITETAGEAAGMLFCSEGGRQRRKQVFCYGGGSPGRWWSRCEVVNAGV